jgi:ADP-ribose pyrophosphatase
VEEVVWQGRWLEMVRKDQWEFVRRRKATGVVAVMAATPAGELLLVRQFRVPMGADAIELPAGLVGDNGEEDPLVAANRELEEETGWRAGKLSFVCTTPSSAGLTCETVQLVLATELVHVGAGGGIAGEESIKVETIPLGEVHGWLLRQQAEGTLVDAKIWAALWLLENFEKAT